MEHDINTQIPVEKPTGNMVILLKDIKSFAGNRDISSVEALVDEAFKSFHTISVEKETKYYQISEKDELIKHIKLKGKGKKMKKTLILVLLLLCVSIVLSALLYSCDSSYHKETDKMIAQCEQFLSQDNLTKCKSEIIKIKDRQLTKNQSEKVLQIESRINKIQKQIEKEQRAAQEQYMKEWEAAIMDDAYRMGRKRGFQAGNDPYAPGSKKEYYLQSGMQSMSNNFYNSNRDAKFYREKPDALPKAVEKYKQGYKDGYEEGWRMSH